MGQYWVPHGLVCVIRFNRQHLGDAHGARAGGERNREAAKEERPVDRMSVRSLCSFLSRRFSARPAIPRAEAQKDVAVGDGAYGGAAAAVLSGLVGILYFLKGGDKSSSEVIGEEAFKQGGMMEASVKEDNDSSDFSLEKYLVEMTELAAAQKEARYNREMSGKKKVLMEVTKSEAVSP
ncbi:unnamed protein product [Urochloa humidicola]